MGQQQCVVCGKWFEESEMVGEYCEQCYLEAAEEEE